MRRQRVTNHNLCRHAARGYQALEAAGFLLAISFLVLWVLS